MHSKKHCLNLMLVISFLVGLNTVHAQDQADAQTRKTEEQVSRLPKYKARPLPTDTFKPSEKISEDFPVPFPVDI